MDKRIKVKEVIDHFRLEIVSGESGAQRLITTSDISRPGLEMAGFFTYYPAERVQLLGKTELTFFDTLQPHEKEERIHKLCHPNTPCIIITRENEIPEELKYIGDKQKLCILRTKESTTKFSSKLTDYLEGRLAPATNLHGVLVDIYGVGILITGGSGIGKSESALELVKRGHRLIADDNVEIRQPATNILIGKAPRLLRHLLEIRGIGIINVMTLFGAGAIRSEKKIVLVIHLELWQEGRQYERLGLDEEKIKIIDTEVPLLTLPVRPGRNLAVIIEVAAMNFRLKNMGYNAAVQFSDQLTEAMEEQEDIE
ncbi:MAG: HPr(Ser) kinase/phosphatase [Bacilli bacterium]